MVTPSKLRGWIKYTAGGMTVEARLRSFRGEADFPVMVRIMNACNRVDELEYNESIQDVARVFSHLTHCDPFTDMRFAEIGGGPAGYSRVYWKDELDGPRLYIGLGFVDPRFRRRGLGTMLLEWNETRLREIAAGHPTGLMKKFQVWTADSIPGAIALLEHHGYSSAREMVEMIRPIREPLAASPLPAGLEIRPVALADVRLVWDAREEAYRDHWGYAPRTDEDYAAWLDSPRFQPKLWKVAWDGHQVAGMVLNYVDQRRNEWIGIRRGYTQDVCVRRPWRRQGLARALLTESIRMFSQMGMAETYLGVDTESPTGADALYASLGYRRSRRHLIYRKPMVAA